MEQHGQPPRGRGVTEFNHFFQTAYQAVVEAVIESAAGWQPDHAADDQLVPVLERLTASVPEFVDRAQPDHAALRSGIVAERGGLAALQEFIQHYGHELFHARFMTLANLRGILHRGVGNYLDYLRDNPDPLHPIPLLDDLDGPVRRADAIRWLEVMLQAVVENYEEYRDYKTTTTQSDYGENLYVLLEFLRLKTSYERHAWQFRPLLLAHEVLARHGRATAAVAGRALDAVDARTGPPAPGPAGPPRAHARRALGTIADRLNERFIKPLALDRLRT